MTTRADFLFVTAEIAAAFAGRVRHFESLRPETKGESA